MRTVARLLTLAILAGALTAIGPSSVRAASFIDIAGSPFEADIEWLATNGITAGCGAGRFCPDAPVTRDQMAKFLVRLFNLPASDVDAFDDDGGAHEPAINAVAAAGITAGCAARRFCPFDPVPRDQMTAFISRAADLSGTPNDYFLDDEASIHEFEIDRAAAAGIASGCGLHRFCPSQPVTRGQMAAFLHRSVQPGQVPPALPGVTALPACRYDDVPAPRGAAESWATTLLDTIYMLPPSYAPSDLVSTSSAGLNGGHSVRSVVRADLAALAAGARSAGHPLAVVSAYRSHATQATTFQHWVNVAGYEAALLRSARPGHSEHQLGTTLDVTHAGGSAPWNYADWATHPTGAWMRDNAWRYGFVMSYPKGSFGVTCYDYEPWHYRFFGRFLAREIHLSGLTSREWLWRMFGD